MISCILLLTTIASFAQAKEVVLLSGFDPFGNLPVNNSWVIAEKVKAQIENENPNIEVVTCLLPTSYQRAVPTLETCLAALPEKPALVLSLGAGPCSVKWETRAHNRDHDHGPDNDGVSRRRKPIIPGAASDIGLRWNVADVYCSLDSNQKKLTTISTSPDNFVCNHTAFRFSHAHPELMYGFVHVPNVNCEKNSPGITERSARLVAHMIQEQLQVMQAPRTRMEMPSTLNSVRLPVSKVDVRSFENLTLESCEQELLSRWRKAF